MYCLGYGVLTIIRIVAKKPPSLQLVIKIFISVMLIKAYEQYSQQFQGMGIDEQSLKNQALEKLIKDEVLLQYVQKQGLVATDDANTGFY